jgi:hypothetical protein
MLKYPAIASKRRMATIPTTALRSGDVFINHPSNMCEIAVLPMKAK